MFRTVTLTCVIAALAPAALTGCRDRLEAEEQPMPDSTPEQFVLGDMPPLNDAERRVIVEKGTEAPRSGTYWDHFEPGRYVCRQCGAALYTSDSKFESECGWPSFDDEIAGAVTRTTDADGSRTEILCTACDGHLGHVFEGEGLTDKNIRHCVNSISIVFVPESTQRAIFAGGCFWGVEDYFEEVPGVLSARSGYTAGEVEAPSYEEVCSGDTGHAEAVEVVFDSEQVSYEQLAKLFFEIHDPTELNRQGPDVGDQYRSAVFYFDDEQKRIVEDLIEQLRELGYDVVTQVLPAARFWAAEDYHQDYVAKNPGRYICHARKARFDTPAQ